MKIFKRLTVVDKEEQAKKERLPLALDRKSKFIYTGGADVMSRWKRHGFVPPSEVRNDYLFKINRESSQKG
jgi:hypothetical protein